MWPSLSAFNKVKKAKNGGKSGVSMDRRTAGWWCILQRRWAFHRTVRAAVGESEIDLLRSPLCVWFVCGEEALWRWSKTRGIREEGRDLEGGSAGGKKEDMKGDMEKQSPGARSLCQLPLHWPAERGRPVEGGVDRDRTYSGWAVASTACKLLAIPSTISPLLTHRAAVGMKTAVAAGRYVLNIKVKMVNNNEESEVFIGEERKQWSESMTWCGSTFQQDRFRTHSDQIHVVVKYRTTHEHHVVTGTSLFNPPGSFTCTNIFYPRGQFDPSN